MAATSVAERLRIKPRTTIWVMPPDRLDRIGPLPDGVTVADSPGRADTALLFVDSEAAARAMLETLDAPRTLWVAVPDGAAEIDQDTLTALLAELRRRPVSRPVRIDDTWVALRVGRMKPGEASPASAASVATADLPAALSAPARGALVAAGIRSLAEAATWRRRDILALHGVGPKSIGPLENALAEAGRTFADA